MVFDGCMIREQAGKAARAKPCAMLKEGGFWAPCPKSFDPKNNSLYFNHLRPRFGQLAQKRARGGMSVKKSIDLTAKKQCLVDLGILMGKREAFTTLAGRCGAAQAESLRRIRDSQVYRELAANWNEFCTRDLKTSRRNVDRMIGWLEEFGPEFFELAQLTGINAEQYRAIAPAVGKDGIHVGTEVVALLPENAEKVAETVLLLQTEAAAARPAKGAYERIAALQQQAQRMADNARRIAKSAGKTERSTLHAAVGQMKQLFARVEMETL